MDNSANHSENTQGTADGEPRPFVPKEIGNCLIGGSIGKGGFGEVFSAWDGEAQQRPVAIKVFAQKKLDAEMARRFERECAAIFQLKHPNIATVYRASKKEDPDFYIVMELVEGGKNITDYCNAESAPVARRLELFLEVCEAVAHAHDKQIIHCDLKPRNILVTTASPKPGVKVIDFGIAKFLGDHAHSDVSAGSLCYRSPEQATGGPIDRASDIYSLGVVLYELLTGERLADTRGATPAGARQKTPAGSPEPPSARLERSARSTKDDNGKAFAVTFRDIPTDLDVIVTKCLCKSRELRYPNAEQLAAEIRRFLKGYPVHARTQQLQAPGDFASAMRALGYMFYKTLVFHRHTVGVLIILAGLGIFAFYMWKRDSVDTSNGQSQISQLRDTINELKKQNAAVLTNNQELYNQQKMWVQANSTNEAVMNELATQALQLSNLASQLPHVRRELDDLKTGSTTQNLQIGDLTSSLYHQQTNLARWQDDSSNHMAVLGESLQSILNQVAALEETRSNEIAALGQSLAFVQESGSNQLGQLAGELREYTKSAGQQRDLQFDLLESNLAQLKQQIQNLPPQTGDEPALYLPAAGLPAGELPDLPGKAP